MGSLARAAATFFSVCTSAGELLAAVCAAKVPAFAAALVPPEAKAMASEGSASTADANRFSPFSAYWPPLAVFSAYFCCSPSCSRAIFSSHALKKPRSFIGAILPNSAFQPLATVRSPKASGVVTSRAIAERPMLPAFSRPFP